MTYTTVAELAAGFRELDADDRARAEAMLEEAALLIDSAAPNASADAKRIVSCRIVRRALGDDTSAYGVPIGTTQGTMSAGGYSTSWTTGSGGGIGELYLGKAERAMLGIGNKIGVASPFPDERA